MSIFVTGRLSFPDLFVPRAYKDSAPRYSATVIVDPGSPDDKLIRTEIAAKVLEAFEGNKVKAEAFLKKVSGQAGKFCYTDGDVEGREEYAGKWVLTGHRAEKKGAPAVIDRQKNADGTWKALVEKDGKPYSGCYVRMKCDIYIQKDEFAGVRCGLLAIQFVKDGDAFAGAPANADGFEDLDSDEDETANSLSEFC